VLGRSSFNLGEIDYAAAASLAPGCPGCVCQEAWRRQLVDPYAKDAMVIKCGLHPRVNGNAVSRGSPRRHTARVVGS
jgi:hypothetical protein